MGWDANIATTEFKGKLPLQSFNQLQAALKERCQGAGIAVPSIFNVPMVKMSDMLPANWFTLFQSTMTTLIAGTDVYSNATYVNHIDNGGDWTGQSVDISYLIPPWTEATILTAIGDGTRLAAPSSRVCAAWCFQQYKILNLLRWIKSSSNCTSCDIKSPVDFSGGWDAAVAAFIAAPWVPSSIKQAGHYFSYIAGTQWRRITRVRTKHAHFNSTPYDTPYDFYAFGMDNNLINYENNDYPAMQYRKLFKFSSGLHVSGTTLEIEMGNFDTVTLWDDVVTHKHWYGTPDNISEHPDHFYKVLKFDGPNGFTYKDW